MKIFWTENGINSLSLLWFKTTGNVDLVWSLSCDTCLTNNRNRNTLYIHFYKVLTSQTSRKNTVYWFNQRQITLWMCCPLGSNQALLEALAIDWRWKSGFTHVSNAPAALLKRSSCIFGQFSLAIGHNYHRLSSVAIRNRSLVFQGPLVSKQPKAKGRSHDWSLIISALEKQISTVSISINPVFKNSRHKDRYWTVLVVDCILSIQQ